MILADSRTTELETVIDTQEFYKMAEKLSVTAKERLYYMMKGIELVSGGDTPTSKE